jgi:serine protease SohB
MEFFLAIALFALKVIVVIAAIAVLAVIILLIVQKGQHLKPLLEIENLNEHYDQLEQTLKTQVLNKKDLKKQAKLWEENQKKWSQETRKKVWILDFKGDIKAHAGDHLREEVTAVLTLATPSDEVVVRVESPGGVVHGYGFCASQLQRVKSMGVPLTVCIDKVAASGGYMMAVVADKVISAPFAIVGSIGVIAQVPNFHRILKKYDVDYKEYTAGAFKRTVSILGEITQDGENKFKSQLEETHILFKNHIQQFRPQLDLNKVATGEYWYGQQAKELGLVDVLSTSDDYLLGMRNTCDLIHISFKTKKTFSEKISEAFGNSAIKFAQSLWQELLQPSVQTKGKDFNQ